MKKKAAKKSDKKAATKPAKKTTTKPAKKASAKTSRKAAAKPTKKVAAKPLKKAVAKLATKPTKQPVAKVVKTLVKKLQNKPAPKSEGFDRFRVLLVELKQRLKGDVSSLAAEALGGGDTDSGDNHAPIHPAEIGTHSFEQEFTLNRLSDDGERLERIEAALDRIEQGVYGACEECGSRIPRARLEVLPETQYCVKCASRLGG